MDTATSSITKLLKAQATLTWPHGTLRINFSATPTVLRSILDEISGVTALTSSENSKVLECLGTIVKYAPFAEMGSISDFSVSPNLMAAEQLGASLGKPGQVIPHSNVSGKVTPIPMGKGSSYTVSIQLNVLEQSKSDSKSNQK
jgi:hypothetical protein